MAPHPRGQNDVSVRLALHLGARQGPGRTGSAAFFWNFLLGAQCL